MSDMPTRSMPVIIDYRFAAAAEAQIHHDEVANPRSFGSA